MVKWFAGARHKLAKKFALADKLTMLLAALVVAGSLVAVSPAFTTAFAAGEVDSNIGGTDLSISRFSEVIAENFNDVLSSAMMLNKGSVNQGRHWMEQVDSAQHPAAKWSVGLGTIGNLLGYSGGGVDAENKANVWTKGTDAASRVMTLQSVAGFYGPDGPTGKSLMSQYIVWGSTLSYLGIDEFRDAQSAADGVRTITGYAMYACFILAYSASSIMGAVIGLMQKFNVFEMFYKGGTQFLYTLAPNSKFLNEITRALEEMYPLRWVVMGFLVIGFAASVTFWKSKGYNQAANAQQKLRNILYRIVVMAIGIPICGMVYTEALNLVDAESVENKTAITDYIFQEFLNFEKWTTGSVDIDDGESTAFKIEDNYTELKVKYETDSQKFTILDGTDATTAIDASRFVFAANRSMYGADVVGELDKANFVRSLFGKRGDPDTAKSYSDLFDGGNRDVAKPEEAYDEARTLILSYARSSTVSPDTLNTVFLLDHDDMISWMTEDVDANATAIEQMFGVNSANQRIWSYIADMGDDWVYEHDGSSITIEVGGSGDKQITVECKGITAFPSAYASGAFVNGNGGLMRRSLANGSGGDGYNGITAEGTIMRTDDNKNYVYEYTYDLGTGGMSAIALYNYMHSKFEGSSLIVYSPDNTTNAGVGLMHYSVTTPYSGIPEIVQLLYVLAIMFSFGIIGWAFGISLLMSTIIQALKAIPVIFKMLIGSVEGFVEGCLIALSIVVELLITVFLYTQAVNIIDLLIQLVKTVAVTILNTFGGSNLAGDTESYAILSGLISIFIIIWGTFELMRWRQAITISIKSMLTHLMNTVFGTSAQMPTGASSGMMKTAAMLGAGAAAVGALAQDGALDDVVNDLTGTDLGTSLHDKISEGDWEGAMQDIQDYAGGTYRGRSDTADAEEALGEGGIGSANMSQTLTDQDEKELAETYDDDIKQADEDLKAAEDALADGKGSQEDVDEARAKRDELLTARAEDAVARRRANYAKANELGVADYGDYLREQAAEAESSGVQPIEGADLPDEPSKQLDRDGHMAYDAAKDGDAQTLRNAAKIYDGNGLNARQREVINEMIADGASETEIAAAIDNFKQDNFGDDADTVIDKINEAAGRDGTETYGSSDNSKGDARTVTVGSSRNETTGGIDYAVTDSNADDGEQIISAVDEDGQSTYTNTTRKEGGFFGIGAKGETHTTVDFGSQAAADSGAMTYGDIHNNMDSVANMSGGMIVKGSGDGKQGWLGPDQTTVTEAASQYAADQAAVVTGSRATSTFTGRGVVNQTAAALQAAGVTDLSQAGSMEAAGVVVENAPTSVAAPPVSSGNLNNFVVQSTGNVTTQSRVAPPSSDGIIYVKNQSGGYTVATGAEPQGTEHFVMQYDEGGQQTFTQTFAGMRYVQNPNGKGYIPQGVAPDNYTPSSIPFEKLQEFLAGGGELDESGNPIFADDGSEPV